MKTSHLPRVALLSLGLFSTTLHAADSAPVNLIENGGFEDATSFAWRIVNTPHATATINEGAAHTGKRGLTIKDESAETIARAMSPNLPTAPGRVYALKFWARTHSYGTCGGISVRFLDATGATAGDATASHAQATDTQGGWQEFTLTATAPEGAATVAAWIHTYSRQEGVVDFDDIELREVTEKTDAKKAR